jgi:hypothetical protein
MFAKKCRVRGKQNNCLHPAISANVVHAALNFSPPATGNGRVLENMHTEEGKPESSEKIKTSGSEHE